MSYATIVYFLMMQFSTTATASLGWIHRQGVLMVDAQGYPFLVNGANMYWMMYEAVDTTAGQQLVVKTFTDAQNLGLNVARTWAFNDGAYRALQTSPGVFDENVFKALDFVVSESGKFGIRLMMTLVNGWPSFGGVSQYEEWARNAGISVSDGDFFTDPTIRGFFRNYVTTILNRVNSITGVAYKNDPNILAWELINEPRFKSDPTGNVIGAWVQEMARHVKSIDGRHLLSTGMEGYYGMSTPDKLWVNPYRDAAQGTDFIRHHSYPEIDFATVHSYPDLWLVNEGHAAQIQFLQTWVDQHILDATNILKKPVLFTEFGKDDKSPNFAEYQRHDFFWTVYNSVFNSMRQRGGGAGALLWQLLPSSMKNWDDGYAIFTKQDMGICNLILSQSQRVASMTSSHHRRRHRRS